MCLYTNSPTPLIAEHDIVCYKVVYNYNTGFFNAIVMNFEYEIGKIYNEPLFETALFCRCDESFYEQEKFEAYYGFHSYIQYNVAKRVCRIVDYRTFNTAVILKCIIPKGSEYYIGNSDSDYCSNNIRVVGWKTANALFWKRKNPKKV